MSERYQIKAKIGQGGIGAVYRAFDTHLQREVAVKRLLPPDESESFDDDPTKSLFKEAHLLSALQHPNVVSVYDVGTDSDGVFVVMELVDGETFDQVVDRGLLTEEDFAEMVSQTLEALIAAQDKALVHRDIKPTNLMVKWLPSGKFQFKLLDFGLAKFSPKPSQQTIGLNDAILGSIHFMAPEQFERLPLDGRTDLYAIGCMYYYGLTGRYPFDGDTAAEVMAAHLSHRLTPIEDVRPDLSKRTCEWVMWLMSRTMDQRPLNAQEALEYFFNHSLEMPTAGGEPRGILPQPATPRLAIPQPGRPVIPGSGPVKTSSSAVKPVSTPVKLGTGPIRPVSAQVRLGSAPVRIGSGAVRPPSVHHSTTGVQPVLTAVPDDVPDIHLEIPTGSTQPHALPHAPMAPPKGMKNPVIKWSVISASSALVIILIAVLSGGFGSAEKKKLKQVAEFVNSDQTSGTDKDVILLTPYLVAPKELKGDQAENLVDKVQEKLETLEGVSVEPALIEQLAKSSGQVQNKLITVVSRRKMHDALGPLTKIVLEADEENARQAMLAIGVLGETRDVDVVVESMMRTKSSSVRSTAETVIQYFIEKAGNKADVVPALIKGLDDTLPAEVQQATLRLLGQTGTNAAASAIEKVLSSGNSTLKLAAVTALRDWPNDGQLDRLAELAAVGATEEVKTEAYKALVRALSLHLDRNRPAAKHRSWWIKADLLSTTPDRKQLLLTGLANVPETFAAEIVGKYLADADPNIRVMATQARKQIEDLTKGAGANR